MPYYVDVNTSTVSDDDTARTHFDCALQRAENLAVFGVKRVLELCVGPSLATLERAYAQHGISVVGNDIDARWKRYHPRGSWMIGDALTLDCTGFDAVVFAPPLSKGCSGRREDALSVGQVVPPYATMIDNLKAFRGLICLVCPARATATSRDRKELHELLATLNDEYHVVPLTSGKRKIVKYNDIYVVRQ